MGGERGIRILNLMISHDQNVWWSRLDGPNGRLLLLFSALPHRLLFILVLLRAVNNAMLDTYQLKSLDGLLEGDLENIAIIQDRNGKLHLRLRHQFSESKASQDRSSKGTDQRLLYEHEIDNFSVRVPYDRVIRCLGWKFDFSIFNK